MRQLALCVAVAVPLAVSTSGPANAVALSFFFQREVKLSHRVAKAGLRVAGQLAVRGAVKPGAVVAGGSLLVSLGDPEPVTYHTGAFSHLYDPTLFDAIDFGWLGDWGADPSLLAPPIDESLWDDLDLVLQDENPLMTASIVATPGSVDFSFDWGAVGYTAPSEDPFYISGVLLRAKHDLRVTEVTDIFGDRVLALQAPSLAVAGQSLTCRPESEPEIRECSGDVTTDYTLQVIPVPGTFLLLAGGLGALAALKKRRPSQT